MGLRNRRNVKVGEKQIKKKQNTNVKKVNVTGVLITEMAFAISFGKRNSFFVFRGKNYSIKNLKEYISVS